VAVRGRQRPPGRVHTQLIVSSARRAPDPLPPLDALQRLLLPVADGFMVAMLSRPPSGTLRTTRVTWPTIALSIATLAGTAVTAGVLVRIAGRVGPLLLIAVVALAALAAGSASLALYGLRQRR
jgi:hypothetical protein